MKLLCFELKLNNQLKMQSTISIQKYRKTVTQRLELASIARIQGKIILSIHSSIVQFSAVWERN